MSKHEQDADVLRSVYDWADPRQRKNPLAYAYISACVTVSATMIWDDDGRTEYLEYMSDNINSGRLAQRLRTVSDRAFEVRDRLVPLVLEAMEIEAEEERAAQEKKECEAAERKAEDALYLALYDQGATTKEAAAVLGVSGPTFRRRAKQASEDRAGSRVSGHHIGADWWLIPDPMRDEILRSDDEQWADIEVDWIARAKAYFQEKEREREQAKLDRWGSRGAPDGHLDTGDRVMQMREAGAQIGEIAEHLSLPTDRVLEVIKERLDRVRDKAKGEAND